MLKYVTQAAMRGASIIGSGMTFVRGTEIDRLTRRIADDVERRTRFLRNSWLGILYRLAGRHPDIDVGDDVLAGETRVRCRLP